MGLNYKGKHFMKEKNKDTVQTACVHVASIFLKLILDNVSGLL